MQSMALSASAVTDIVKDDKKSLGETLKIGSYFMLWYVFNIAYNIYNKKVLNMAPKLTYTTAFLQLFLGLFYVGPIWALKIRKAPVLNVSFTVPVSKMSFGKPVFCRKKK